ncbi:hypothetical protein F5148DRAFT_577477 [Russula earlei]|uniref:Uncharacterized protein n=1 Tax=Russula earlei TaxID=71964 RepID=A0ACC0TXB1_9AGAM|nr:hypothetical protein F5148DRAFT_577477 [Russula earlei]
MSLWRWFCQISRLTCVSFAYSYTNYARLVMSSFGFQMCSNGALKPMTRSSSQGAPRPSSRFSSIPWSQQVTYILHQMVVLYLPRSPRRSYSSFYAQNALSPRGLKQRSTRVIECLIATIGFPQIAIDQRHTPKLYSRFLASLLAKHKRDGTAQGRMPQQGPPPQQIQTGSSTPMYQQPPQPPQSQPPQSQPPQSQPPQSQPPQSQPPQQPQQRQQQQPAPPPQNTTSSSLSSGVSGNAGAPDSHQSVPQNSGAAAPPNFTNAVSTEGPGNYVLEQPPDFTFGVTGQPGELMDFTFDTITTPGNNDLLATMQAIQNPTWWQNMMMPGFLWPVIQDHTNTIGMTWIPIRTCNNMQKDFAAKHTRPGYTRTSGLTHQPATFFATIRLMKCLFHPRLLHRPSCIDLPLSLLCVT